MPAVVASALEMYSRMRSKPNAHIFISETVKHSSRQSHTHVATLSYNPQKVIKHMWIYIFKYTDDNFHNWIVHYIKSTVYAHCTHEQTDKPQLNCNLILADFVAQKC